MLWRSLKAKLGIVVDLIINIIFIFSFFECLFTSLQYFANVFFDSLGIESSILPIVSPAILN